MTEIIGYAVLIIATIVFRLNVGNTTRDTIRIKLPPSSTPKGKLARVGLVVICLILVYQAVTNALSSHDYKGETGVLLSIFFGGIVISLGAYYLAAYTHRNKKK